METKVFEQQHLAGCGQHRLNFGADAIGRQFYGLAQEFLKLCGNRFHTHLGIPLALWTPQMGRKNHARSLFESILDSGQRSADALVAGYFLAGIGQRDIEIHPDEDTLTLQIQVFYRQF